MSENLQQPDMILLCSDLAKDFKASYHWLTVFIKRNKLTPVWFDIASNITVNPKSEKTVHIWLTGNEKNKFTVVLTCATDGTKLPLICIFKEKKLNRGEQIHSGIIVWHQENSWMNTELILRYLKYLDDEKKNGPKKDLAMLVYDSFRDHLEDSVKNKFCKYGFNLAVIPSGAGKTAKGNLRHARIIDICTWVKNSWENISDEIIRKSFVICKILDNSSEPDNSSELDSSIESDVELEIVNLYGDTSNNIICS
ncbi:11859_t:CDS:2 [Gigaspora margarita]|uniref:11859_t:CDS:1 n=1 Tax=Gigaspora margarita TaxID=4874 RepID=A0ABN7UU40_GIGMA|nr:11859_t:CDS:2 [Gigaspora margarita]